MTQMTTLFPVRGLISFALTGLFLFFEMGVQVSPNVMALPLMQAPALGGLGLNATQLSFLASVYFYSYALMMIPVGLLYDRFKLKQVMLIALLILSLGNLLFFASASFLFLALARLLMGFGSAFAFVGVLCVVKACFPKAYFPFFVGLTQLMAAIGAMIGETPIAWLVNYTSWRTTSFVFFLSSLVLLLLIALFVHVPKEKGSNHTHNKQEILQSLQRILKNKQSYVLACYAFFCWGSIIIFAGLWGATYEQVKFNVSPNFTGFLSMFIWISLALTSPMIGRLVAKKYSHKQLMSVTVFIGMVASLFLLYWPGLNYFWAIFLSMGIGIGAAGQILSFDLVRMNNQANDFGVATGLNNIGVVSGGVILHPLVGFLLDKYTQANEYTVFSFNHALWLIPACFFMALIISLWLIDYKFQH